MTPTPLTRLRRICLGLPEAHEVLAWGEPTFRIRRRMFAMFASAANHHGAGRDAVWVKADHVTQDVLVDRDPERYFVPPYVGVSGWFGMYLDEGVDWLDVEIRLREAARLVAPKRVVAALEALPEAARSPSAPAAPAVRARAGTRPR